MSWLSVKYMPKPSKGARMLFPKHHKPSSDGYDIVKARQCRLDSYNRYGSGQ